MKEIKTATGEIIKIRESRIEQVRDFLESGEQEREIVIHENEMIGNVRAAIYNTINQHQYFKTQCFVQIRNYRLYLVRR